MLLELNSFVCRVLTGESFRVPGTYEGAQKMLVGRMDLWKGGWIDG